MLKILLILPCLSLMFQPLNAKVEAPNYNFSLDTLADFNPGKLKSDLDAKYGTPELIGVTGPVTTFKYQVAHLRYKFPVLVQVSSGKVDDFFARLPSYFLHDVFFQSLINRLGKQDTYKKVGEEAVYQWNKNPLKHVYSAACTITCFTIFYAVHADSWTPRPLIEKMKEAVPKATSER